MSAFSSGTRVGPYELIAPLGAGGMGEAYRARDSRLGRDVAIKSLPAAFAGDPERLARFRREAQTLANRARVSLSIFDPLGRRIASPLRDVDQAAGRHQIELSTTGWRPGVYYYRFDAGGATATRKMVVVN